MVELDADADERAARVERLAEHAEHRGALLEQLEQALVRLELVPSRAFEQAGRAADVQALALLEQLRERGPQRRQESGLALGEARVLEPLAELVRPRLQARERVVQVLAGPVCEPGINGLGKGVDALRDRARGGDDDDHHDLGLQKEDLDVADRGALERRRRDEREQARDRGEHLGRRLERGFDLCLRSAQVERERPGVRLQPLEQPVRVVAVGRFRRHAPGRRVRVGQQAERFELGELGADGR